MGCARTHEAAYRRNHRISMEVPRGQQPREKTNHEMTAVGVQTPFEALDFYRWP
jgi:hypothetical protein